MDFYRSHWIDIDEERLAVYDTLQWNPMMEPFFQGLCLEEAQCLIDYGTGAGWMALEMARRIPENSHVIGCDINEKLLELAERHGQENGLSGKVNWRHVTDDRIPLPDKSADRIFCRNTLSYVPSIDEMMTEFRRVLKPGGMARMIDSDWGLFAVEPCKPAIFKPLMEHAKHAFSDPQAGRHLYGAARRIGFKDVQVSMFPVADTAGALIGTPIKTLAAYAKAAGFPSETADRFILDCQEALAKQELIIIMPMFMITATAP